MRKISIFLLIFLLLGGVCFAGGKNSAPNIDSTNVLSKTTAGEIAAMTEKTTPVAADVLLIEDSAASNAKKKVQVGNLPAPALGDASVTQAKLKTTSGEVSVVTYSLEKYNVTLPGGTYGFYPQVKGNSATHFDSNIFAHGGSESYITNIGFTNGGDGNVVCYAQQRYVTSSGEDYWIFLLIDKETKDIVSAYAAPDHPAYGNGGNFNKVPHPFPDYDATKQEIIIVDNATITELKAQVTAEKSLLTLVNELYKPNMVKEEVYQPLHSGKYLTENKDGKQVQVKQLVESLPSYIKVRKLSLLTAEDKTAKLQRAETRAQEAQAAKDKEDLIQAKIRELSIETLKNEGKLTAEGNLVKQ
jgi:hypothetical protein